MSKNKSLVSDDIKQTLKKGIDKFFDDTVIIDCADDSTAEGLKDKLKKDMLKREIKKVEEVAKCLKDQ
jgi:hypothetical protein